VVAARQSSIHDSVEDARTALHLYKKYVELQRSNSVAAALEELYALGRASGWKVTTSKSMG
jgi:PAB-dependent poly(A)-specific ribonuclease subunit 2